MVVSRFYEPALAQASYLIGCLATGEAIVIDPNRDVERYLTEAAAHGLTITHVTETHIHADFLSGARELTARTGAALFLSDAGDADWKYAFAAEGKTLRDGDRIDVGNVAIDVIETPGHTPEHLTFLVTDRAAADQPIAAVTGDFIFVGDVGRPDLLERAANMHGTMAAGARTLWKSLRRFDRYPDWMQLWPGHGAGSACGKGISAVPSSTLGYERRFNWAFRVASEDAFVTEVLAGQPEPPKYFATMKRLNKTGPTVLGGFRTPPVVDDLRLLDTVRSGALVVDTRTPDAYASVHVPGMLNIPLGPSFVTWAGWLLPYDRDLHLVADDVSEAGRVELVRLLALIGLDRVAGVFGARAIPAAAGQGAAMATVPQVTPAELSARLAAKDVVLVDVRGESEWLGGHVPAAMHIPLGYLPDRLQEIPADRPVVVQCQAGARSAIAASVLERAGRSAILNLTGGFAAWTAAGFPVERPVRL